MMMKTIVCFSQFDMHKKKESTAMLHAQLGLMDKSKTACVQMVSRSILCSKCKKEFITRPDTRLPKSHVVGHWAGDIFEVTRSLGQEQ